MVHGLSEEQPAFSAKNIKSCGCFNPAFTTSESDSCFNVHVFLILIITFSLQETDDAVITYMKYEATDKIIAIASPSHILFVLYFTTAKITKND